MLSDLGVSPRRAGDFLDLRLYWMASLLHWRSGMTLIEVCISMVVLTTAALGVGQLSGLALKMSAAARLQSTTTILAMQKTEQLRSLEWPIGPSGSLVPWSDPPTDLSRHPLPPGGTGLAVSPQSSLDANTPGYVDYLDRHAAWVGNGAIPPPTAVFVRRWNVSQLSVAPGDARVLRVLVTTVVRDSEVAPALARRRLPGDALTVTILSRKVR